MVGNGQEYRLSQVLLDIVSQVSLYTSSQVSEEYAGLAVSCVSPNCHHGIIVIIGSLFQSSIMLPCQSRR